MAFLDYDIDFRKLIKDLLELDRRTPDRIAWLHSLTAAVNNIYNDFIVYADSKKKELSYAPGYKLQIEKLLSEIFGDGITITNSRQSSTDNYLYERSDLRNLGKYDRRNTKNSYLNGRGEFNLSFTNFTINVPASIVFDEDQLRAVVNKYKRVGMTYNIVII